MFNKLGINFLDLECAVSFYIVILAATLYHTMTPIFKILASLLHTLELVQFHIPSINVPMVGLVESQNNSTMLQKLSKCEVKAWLCWNLKILPPFRFCWNHILANSNGTKMSFIYNARDTELWILVNLGLGSCSDLLKIKIQNL